MWKSQNWHSRRMFSAGMASKSSTTSGSESAHPRMKPNWLKTLSFMFLESNQTGCTWACRLFWRLHSLQRAAKTHQIRIWKCSSACKTQGPPWPVIHRSPPPWRILWARTSLESNGPLNHNPPKAVPTTILKVYSRSRKNRTGRNAILISSAAADPGWF